MGTARELLYSAVYGDDAVRYKEYKQGVRNIRGYPNYFRLRDDVTFSNGPVQLSGKYDGVNVWRAEVLKDKHNIYVQRASDASHKLLYTHSSPVENVSLQFDQAGRPMFTFESEGKVFLRWFDPVPAQTVTEEVSEGITPKIINDSLVNPGSIQSSERFLFYLKAGNLYWRRQSERFTVEHLAKDFESKAVELLEAGPTLYGNISCIVCYEEEGVLKVASISSEDLQMNIASKAKTSAQELLISSLNIRNVVNLTAVSDSTTTSAADFDINSLTIKSVVVEVSAQNTAEIAAEQFELNSLAVVIKVVKVDSEVDTVETSADSLAINDLLVRAARILIEPSTQENRSKTDSSEFIINSLTVN